MPPSPAVGCSPGRELRGDIHKRGRSLEGGILFREKDDDLALFNEMQTRESDNFLLQSNDDFEDIFSTKSRYFSDYKFGISIPMQGQSSDLLNADGDKSDYDWLLTPPDTPLFPSLDDETPPVTLAPRGRTRSQPITISRSSTMEKSRRSSRGSASPNRLSPSPRSGNSTFQMRGRPSSAPHSSPTPSLRQATPSRRPSPPPSKPSTPAPRSSTPTPRRMNIGSGGPASSAGVRGTSPVNASRGNSASPKVRAWKTNIPGFSLDAPPNLRTSLADRPAAYVRGSSPSSKNSKGLSSRSGRHSMSPTASRSVSSSYSHDRDQFSSHSKGSVASSGDDDVDSLQSVPISSSDRSASRSLMGDRSLRLGALQNNKAPAFSKNPIRTGLSSSVPKRSFDSALRQMDRQKGPQNMFRSLLSSVPSSTFYAGKTTAAHRALISRNSSVTTSSNTSSDQATSGAHDTEGSDQNHDDMASECGKTQYPDVQGDVFAFEKAVAVNDDISPGGDLTEGARVDSQLGSSNNESIPMALTPTSEVSEVKDNFREVDSTEDLELCSKCGSSYHALDLAEGDLKLCPDCRRSVERLTATSTVPNIIVSKNSPSLLMNNSDERVLFEAMDPLLATPESSEDVAETRAVQYEENAKEGQTLYAEPSLTLLSENSFAGKLVEGGVQLANQSVIGQPIVGYNPSTDGEPGIQHMQHLIDCPNLNLDISEGAGISILLKKSSSGTGPVVQGRTFATTSIAYDDPSYVREGMPSTRSSLGQGSVSASSSVDLGSARQIEIRVQQQLSGRTTTSIAYDDPSYVREGTPSTRNSLGQGSVSASSSVDLDSARQTEIRVQRQLSGRKSNIETYRYDIITKHQCTGSSLSGTSTPAFQGLGLATSLHEENLPVSVTPVENEVLGVTNAVPKKQLMASESAGLYDTCPEGVCNNHYGTMAASMSELSTNAVNVYSGDSSVASFSNAEDFASNGNVEDFQNDVRSISIQDKSTLTPEPSIAKEDTIPNSIIDREDVAEVPIQSSLDTISEIGFQNCHVGSPDSQSDIGSPNSRSAMDELPEPSIATTSDKDITVSVAEADNCYHAHGFPEESTKAKSLTLEEATDTILFCSSIIHNLAYEAATIAIEKENSVPLEVSRPMLTILGNPKSDRKDPHNRTTGKPKSKSQKARQRQVERDTKLPSDNSDTDEKADVLTATRIVGVPNKGDGLKPPKLESKCNCSVM
ncbi:hypothetical protein U1Q18_017219 [Sarracenia purpurea var. burkii]